MDTLRQKLHTIIFENQTAAGRRFDIILLWCILLSVVIAMLDSEPPVNRMFGRYFYALEWLFTILFTIEYILRLYSSHKKFRYALSTWGIVDLLAILPTYLSLFFYGAQYFMVVRVFRLLRVFRILRMVRFNREANVLISALHTSSLKISIFFSIVVTIVVLLGTMMYVIEHPAQGFTSIPQSIYWAVITVTTVGYGDVVPHTVIGQFIASFAMMIGYAIIAVPTGIVTVEMSRSSEAKASCMDCGYRNIISANYCNQCGNNLTNDTTPLDA